MHYNGFQELDSVALDWDIKTQNTHKTARACINPITEGICPERRLPCKDLEWWKYTSNNHILNSL